MNDLPARPHRFAFAACRTHRPPSAARGARAWAIALALALSSFATLERTALARDFPIEIGHRFGTSVIETRPDRVATVDFTGLDNLLALGVQPVLVRTAPGEPIARPWAEPLLQSEPLAVRGDIDYETVASARPDVIIALWSGIDRDGYDKLSAIAPVVAVPEGVGDYALAWDELLLRTGRAIGREERARAVVDELSSRSRAIRDAHPDWQDRTATVAFRTSASFGVYGPTDVRPRLLATLGLEMPEGLLAIADPARPFIELSEERIGLVDADVVLWGSFGEAADVRDMPLRGALDVAREGREVFVEPRVWYAMGFASALSLPIALDWLVPRIEAAIDGDPDTPVEPE